jgi:hypothetical protein
MTKADIVDSDWQMHPLGVTREHRFLAPIWMLPAWADFRSTTVVSVCWTIKSNCDDFDAIPRIGRSAQYRNRCSRSLFQANGRLPLWFSQFITT